MARGVEQVKKTTMSAKKTLFGGPRGGLLLGGGLCVALLAGGGCTGEAQECKDNSKAPLEQCRIDLDKAKSEVSTSKRQLESCEAGGESGDDGSALKPAAVREVLQKGQAQLRRCYEAALKRSPRLSRQKISLTLTFKVSPSGEPDAVTMQPNPDYAMTDCMKKAVRRLNFPEFTGTALDVEAPLLFAAKR